LQRSSTAVALRTPRHSATILARWCGARRRPSHHRAVRAKSGRARV